MRKTKSLPFAEFRDFLKGLGYTPKRAPNAWLFKHRKEGSLVFRLYEDDEYMDIADVMTTRLFLDYWGLMEPEVFDAFLRQGLTPAKAK